MNFTDNALYYSKILGWHIIPVHTIVNGVCSCQSSNCASPGKHPATENGLSDASTDETTIRAWWNHFDYNIGVVMEPSGILACDVDLYHKDLDKLFLLQQTHGEL